MASKADVKNIVNERRLRPIYGKYTIDNFVNNENVHLHKFLKNLVLIFNRY